jgi:ABC-type nitrate/sulfonate/bicarbonate transport system substrate-binding protein
MTHTRISVGFIPLLDCACIVAAAEQGFAAEEGLELQLTRESSWANVRDRIIIGHFDAAHMLGPMTVASTLGIGHVTEPLIAPFSLGLGGNAITVSISLWEQMVSAGATPGAGPEAMGIALRKVLGIRNRARHAPLTFGIVYPFSCHNYELRYWLAASGIDPDQDVRLVVIPPPFLVDAMRAGQVDGFCVGEPWNSVAVDANAGVIVTPTTAIWPLSPEKVLGCRASWAERHPETLSALLRALYRAALWCEQPANHGVLARLLSDARYVGAPAELLHRALANRLVLVPRTAAEALQNFYVLGRHHATFPWASHALWFYSQMVRWGQVAYSNEHAAIVRSTYRPDLYRAALAPLGAEIPAQDAKSEQLFDGRVFDPAAPVKAYLS